VSSSARSARPPSNARRNGKQPASASDKKPRGAIRIIKRHAPDFEPGADFEYSDSNYTLLGIVLQKLAGRSVESVIKRAILKRLELRETSFPTTPNLRTPFSHGYYAGNDGTEPIMDYTAVNPAVPWTAGGMVSTIDDLRRWGKALATGTLISKRLQRKRLKFGTAPNPGGPPAGYGLGILRFGDWIGHDGAIFGFSTVTMYLPSNGAQIVAVANLSTNATTPTFDMFRSIAKRLYPSSLD
jgi:D-alanyl-D-alanine carboxypeptidase